VIVTIMVTKGEWAPDQEARMSRSIDAMDREQSNGRRFAEGGGSFRGDGAAARTEAYRAVYGATHDPRRATAAYCRGNRWLEENARAVGNMR
jgi:hypothetical protein